MTLFQVCSSLLIDEVLNAVMIIIIPQKLFNSTHACRNTMLHYFNVLLIVNIQIQWNKFRIFFFLKSAEIGHFSCEIRYFSG